MLKQTYYSCFIVLFYVPTVKLPRLSLVNGWAYAVHVRKGRYDDANGG